MHFLNYSGLEGLKTILLRTPKGNISCIFKQFLVHVLADISNFSSFFAGPGPGPGGRSRARVRGLRRRMIFFVERVYKPLRF